MNQKKYWGLALLAYGICVFTYALGSGSVLGLLGAILISIGALLITMSDEDTK